MQRGDIRDDESLWPKPAQKGTRTCYGVIRESSTVIYATERPAERGSRIELKPQRVQGRQERAEWCACAGAALSCGV